MLQRSASCARHDFQIQWQDLVLSSPRCGSCRSRHRAVPGPRAIRWHRRRRWPRHRRRALQRRRLRGRRRRGRGVAVHGAARPVGARPGAGPPIAVGTRVALLNAPTPLVVVAYDDAYAVVSGPDGNRAYQRDMLRAFEAFDDEALNATTRSPRPSPPMDDDDDDDEGTRPRAQLARGETVLVGRVGHVATVEQVPRAGDDEVLLRWESTGHCEEVALSEVEKLSAGRSSRRSAPRAPVATPRPSPRPARPAAPQRPRVTPSPTPAEATDSSDDDASSVHASAVPADGAPMIPGLVKPMRRSRVVPTTRTTSLRRPSGRATTSPRRTTKPSLPRARG